jgi:hypothetical protein
LNARLAGWKPPSGWVPGTSLVPGITVFAPAPQQEAPEQIRTQCPSCAGTLAFDPAKSALVCGFCDHVEREAPDAVGPSEGHEFTLEALRRAAHGWGSDRRTLRCEGCGGEISVEPAAIATTCPFCASAKVQIVADDGQALRPGFVLPFALRDADVGPRVRDWLGQGWMHPGELKSLAAIDRVSGLYLPWWLFDAGVDATWEAEVGKTRTVVETDDDGKVRTRTEIDWEWKSGSVRHDFDGVRIPGSTKLSKRLLERVHGTFDLDRLGPYAPEVLAGFRASGWDVGLPEAWEQGRGWIREETRKLCHAQTGSAHVRNFRMTCSLRDETWRYALLPVWVSAYRYGDRVWQVLVNGQTAAVAGQKPVVWGRIYAVMALTMVPAVCSGVLGLPLLLVGGLGTILLVFAFVFLVLAMIGSWALYQRAVEAEAP